MTQKSRQHFSFSTYTERRCGKNLCKLDPKTFVGNFACPKIQFRYVLLTGEAALLARYWDRNSVSPSVLPTPDCIPPQLWPPNNRYFIPVDYNIWYILEQRVYRTGIYDVDYLRTRLVEELQNWEMFDQKIIDWAIKQWRPRLQASFKNKDILNISCSLNLLERKEEYFYSAFIQRLVSRRSEMDHTVLPANYTMPAFPL